jgi:outer membrane protein
MDDRKSSWFFGGGFRYQKITLLYARDIQGRSHGKKLTLHYSEMYPLGEKFFTRSSVGLECYNVSYADYYYGVRANEVSATRAEYHPNNYCLPTVSFFPIYKYNEHVNLLTGLSFKVLTKDVRRSPTTTGTWLESALILGGTWVF